MTKEQYIPAKGDIAWMVLDPRVGHEQSGHRPVLVISNKNVAKHTGVAIIVPITTRDRGPIFSYQNPIVGTSIKGVALPLHVRSVDYKKRKAKYIERIRGKKLDNIVETVKVLLD